MIIDNEEIIMSQNKNDYESLKNTMSLFGYTENGTDFFETKQFKKLLETFIQSNIPIQYNKSLPALTTKNIRKKANEIIEEETKGINREIPYLPGDSRIIYDYIAQTGDIEIQNGKALANFLRLKMKKKEVTELPVYWKIDEERSGQLCILHYNLDNHDFLENCPVVTAGIYMINENDILGTVHLAHEMTHALTDRNKGIIKNIYNSEVLSIYMELVAAYSIDKHTLLDTAIKDRLSLLKQNILEEIMNKQSGYSESEGICYIDSSLYSFALFERYKKDKDKVRKEINQTLSGNRTLEETLEKLDITENKGSKIIIKELKRRSK